MRDGTHSFYELTNLGREMLGRRHVLPGVSVLLKAIQVEGTLDDAYVLISLIMVTTGSRPAAYS